MKQFVVLVAFFLAIPAHAEVYKCKNDRGQITYQQTPCQAAMVSKINRVPDVSVEERTRAQERAANIIAGNEKKEAARELERLQRNENIRKYELEKKAEELEKRKLAQEVYKDQLLRRQVEAAERSAAAAERAAQVPPARVPRHCTPDYAGGFYCN